MSGEDYFENYYYKGQALVALGIDKNNQRNIREGLKVLTETIETIEELKEVEELPKGREPETKFFEDLMIELSSNVKACINQSNWRSCLINKLD